MKKMIAVVALTLAAAVNASAASSSGTLTVTGTIESSILTSTGTYASTGSYSWDVVVADSAAAAAIDNSISFTATSN